MKKGLIVLLGAGLLLSSCGSYEASGAYTGSMFGDMLGSAIGGIAGGWRGHEIGSLIGTVGGAAIGAAIGSAADREQHQRQQEATARRQRVASRRGTAARQGAQGNQAVPDSYDRSASPDSYGSYGSDDSGFDPEGRGDDRITFMNEGSADPGATLVIRNAGVFEGERDGMLTRNETCSVVFEIRNVTDRPIMDVFPLVEEVTRNKHVHISPNLRIESIGPRQAVRYTATLHADSRLRDGQIEVRVGVAQGSTLINSQTRQFSVPTSRRFSASAAR